MKMRMMQTRPARGLSTTVLTLCAAGACVSNPVLRTTPPPDACGATSSGAAILWRRAVASNEIRDSNRWCSGVGSPAVIAEAAAGAAETPLTVISWNTHVGGGDIAALVADARSGRLTGTPTDSLVLLLQEVYRQGDGVPASPPAGFRSAEAQMPLPPGGTRRGIAATARALGLSLFYVPSMRNGRTTEDRGNAILSSARLDGLEAIELPLEGQRRVAVAARIQVGTPASLTLRLVSTHFTNVVGHHLWVLSEPGRVRQARTLSRALADDEPTLVGGDLNSWFGYADGAFRELARVLPLARPADRRPTFGPMRLDHVLARLPSGWRLTVRRADSRYGSDHYPLIATIASPH
jgi:endonuclease/exonuclease/phosphatase family metal-dependent hydrolase